MSKVYTKEVTFAAGMNTRSCIWWGVLCTWDLFRTTEAAKVKDSLNTCVRWYYDPSEVNRAAAAAILESGQANGAIKMLLQAIFFTGNVAPEKCPEVMLDANSSKLMVASCLDMLLAKAPVIQREAYVERFEQLYREVIQTAV